ncbi:MAG: hypothetical protein MK085_13830 [Phycisphaerales bacterium]|nr:hypothetical protein [Phycisphaerales bacterium]
MPYLSGERTPHPDPDARGCWIGLTGRHDRGHMMRAVMEGVTHGLRECLDLIRGTGIQPDSTRLSGGGARSTLWQQLCADLFNTPIAITNSTEGTAYGAALLAAVGAQAFDSVESACRTAVREVERIQAGHDAQALEAAHPVYSALYPALRESFKASARLHT